MANDEALATGVENLSSPGGHPGRRAMRVVEMLGGGAMMAGGKLLVGGRADDPLARVGPDALEESVARPRARARVFDFSGRPGRGTGPWRRPACARTRPLVAHAEAAPSEFHRIRREATSACDGVTPRGVTQAREANPRADLSPNRYR